MFYATHVQPRYDRNFVPCIITVINFNLLCSLRNNTLLFAGFHQPFFLQTKRQIDYDDDDDDDYDGEHLFPSLKLTLDTY